MTQLGQMYEKEEIEYANKKTREMALKMLKRNIDIVDIMEVTGMTEAEILRLQDEAVTVQQHQAALTKTGSFFMP